MRGASEALAMEVEAVVEAKLVEYVDQLAVDGHLHRRAQTQPAVGVGVEHPEIQFALVG